MGRPRGVAMLAAITIGGLLTSAGACQREWDGDLPPPDELGAAPFPDGAVLGGVDAVYARFTGDDGAAGAACHSLVRFRPDGTAEIASSCSDRPIADVAAAAATWTDPRAVGDYAVDGATIRIRTVEWDPLAEELVLDEWQPTVCGTELRSGTGTASELVAGTAPPGAPPCG